jgi:hypothetical protein
MGAYDRSKPFGWHPLKHLTIHDSSRFAEDLNEEFFRESSYTWLRALGWPGDVQDFNVQCFQPLANRLRLCVSGISWVA